MGSFLARALRGTGEGDAQTGVSRPIDRNGLNYYVLSHNDDNNNNSMCLKQTLIGQNKYPTADAASPQRQHPGHEPHRSPGP